MPDVKKACKRHKCTLNEGLLGVLGITLKEYAVMHNEPSLSEITISQAVAIGSPPQDLSELTFTNTWVPQYHFIPVHQDLEFCL